MDRNSLCNRTLPLPPDSDEQKLQRWLKSVRVEGGGKEIEGYVDSDFARFVFTLDLFSRLGGRGKRAVEFGANPYFMSVLARRFSEFDWTYSNWFGAQPGGPLLSQRVSYRDFDTGEERVEEFAYYNFNSERDRFPLLAESYDLALYCEIIEHLTSDPCRPLRKIRNLLKPTGHLVLTTPNVARFENVMRLVDGKNIYDPYSGYGAYGRHNREYTRDELARLLRYVGFEVEEIFTADVHPYHESYEVNRNLLKDMVAPRSADLGQYIFVRARKSPVEGQKLPAWLYRSISPDRMAMDDCDKTAAYSAELKLQEMADEDAGKLVNLVLAITNTGCREWSDDFRLGARAFRGNDVVREFRGPSTGTVGPGQRIQLRMGIDVSGLPISELEIVIDLLSEHRFWFEDVGSTPLSVVAPLKKQ